MSRQPAEDSAEQSKGEEHRLIEPADRPSDVPQRFASLTATGVFDPCWYRDEYLGGSGWAGTPEDHFKTEGAWRGHRPNRFFDTRHYLDAFPALRRSGLDPLTHYLAQGEQEGARPNPEFDPVWYAATYPSHHINAWGPFAHFCAHGWRLGLSTHAGQVDPTEQIVCKMRADGLFDPDLYRRLNPDIAAAGIDPLRHYVDHGSREGRQPHPLFDVGFYLDQISPKNGDEDNVVWHYARVGSALNINPNTWFDNAWYKRKYGATMRPHETPVSHFMRVGGYATNPSLFFDAIRYRRSHHASTSRLDPLSDFMLDGMDAGRPAHPVEDDAIARLKASAVRMTCIKQGSSLGARPTALFVTFAARGRIKSHVPHYADAMRQQGIDVVLIVAAPERTTVLPPDLIDSCAAVYLRENSGFDFAAWAHVIDRIPEVLESPVLYLTNDSIVGPVDRITFKNLIESISASDEDIVGLTDNRFYAWHLQSFFLAIKKRCLTSDAFRSFWRDVVNRTNKDAVIRSYEITLTARLVAAGFSAKPIFPMTTRHAFEGNRTILNWKQLLQAGMPFVKASLLIGEHRGAEAAVRAALDGRGYDTSRFDATFEFEGQLIAASLDEDQAE